MPLCGPKLSQALVILSAWGAIQLAITGILFHLRSVSLIKDVTLDREGFHLSSEDLINDLEVKYDAGALNCWIAALMYVVTFCLSFQQFYQHEKAEQDFEIKPFTYGSLGRTS